MTSDLDPRLIYFIHIQKTSGTSIRRYLMQSFGKKRVLWHSTSKVKTEKNLANFVDTPDLDIQNYRAVGGHLGFAKIPPAILKRGPIIISMIRDPLTRALSQYQHVTTRSEHPLYPKMAGLSLYEALQVQQFRRLVDGRQLDYLCGKNDASLVRPRLQNYGYIIGKQEKSEQFFDTLSQRLGLKRPPDDPRVNVSTGDYKTRIQSQEQFDSAFQYLKNLNEQESIFYNSFEDVLVKMPEAS